ncbi:MAG: YvcK family protein [Bryobacterales bacterium]|nr:YvcK family protein [Bryobacteraceae bacterium]MDW8355296.1 YvcK family protein [Bryobacterales bacterium]
MSSSPHLHPPPDAPLRIVAIGGGTGLATLLQGLKQYARLDPPQVQITAVVTVTDDGGSSGRLRRQFDVPPPGDIRNCMVALSEDEALLSRLFEYRFPAGRGLKGHSFGNLFLTALSRITGDFAHAVRVSSEVLAIVGRIYPSTVANVTLEARLEDGAVVAGESRISKSRVPIERVVLRPPDCQPLEETVQALAEADLITLGPGSLFTSVIPNLLVHGIPEAIRQSPAVTAYIVNLMWQPGETLNFTAADHVCAVLRHAPQIRLDYAVVNTRPVSERMCRKYARQRARPVEADCDRLERLGLTVVARDVLEETDKVRHNPAALAQVALELAREGRRRRSGPAQPA